MESLAHKLEKIDTYLTEKFDTEFVPAIEEFIRIPNLSKSYDAEWETNGLLEKAAHHYLDFAKKVGVHHFSPEIIKHPGKSPLIYGEIPATDSSKGTVLLYGHFDKQPHMDGWHAGLSATNPVIKNGRLYGRGGADDGYAWFSSMLVLKALQLNEVSHGRIIIVFEGDEESGTGDLLYYFNHLKERIGKINLLICLDSGCYDYEHFLITTTLRGVVSVIAEVSISECGIHSGDAGGVIPDTFRIWRNILERIEDSKTGQIIPEFQVQISPKRYAEAHAVCEVAWNGHLSQFPKLPGTSFTSQDPFEAYLNRGWRAQLTVTGQDGLPATGVAGNVIRKSTTLKLSMRIPPTLDSHKALENLKSIITKDVPYGAKMKILSESHGGGFNNTDYSEKLSDIIKKAALHGYKKPALFGSEGGAIPFVGELAQLYPEAELIVTGVLGPESNAHGPNEFLHLDYTRKIQKTVAYILAHYQCKKTLQIIQKKL